MKSMQRAEPTAQPLLALVDITEVPGHTHEIYRALSKMPYVREAYVTFASPHITALVEANDLKGFDKIRTAIGNIGYAVANVNVRPVMRSKA